MNNIFTRSCLYVISSLLALLLCSSKTVAQPIANFTASQLSGCSPMVVNFQNTSTGITAGTTYNWTLGNGNFSTNFNASGTYVSTSTTSATTYTVTLTVTNPNGQTSTKQLTLTVYASPTASFTATDTLSCPPLSATFNSSVTWNAPGSGSYLWDFGNGSSSTQANPSYTFYTPGFYTVTMVAVNSAGCTTLVQRNNYIHVWPQPNPAFTASPNSICNPPATTTFTNTSTGTGPYTASWEFGDGGNGTGNSVTHTYNATGNYNIQLIVIDAHGCMDTLNQPGYISVGNLSADFNAPPTACAGTFIQFTSTTTPTPNNCIWDFGDNTSPVGGLITNHMYTTAGTYNVRMVAFKGGCTDTVVKQITINPKPVVDFVATNTAPCPAPVTIPFVNNTTGATSYHWEFGDGSFSGAASPSNTYNANGVYDVLLIATSAFGCVDSLRKPAYIKVYPLDLAILPDNTGGCIPATIHFAPAVTYVNPVSQVTSQYPYPVTSYTWNFGDGYTSTLDSPSHIYTAYGTYTVSLVITTSNGCTQTAYTTIQAGTPPTANFWANPLVACVGSPVYFFDSSSSNVTSWHWDFGDGNSSNTSNPTYYYPYPGTYSVKLTVYNNGCKDTMVKTNYIHVNFPKSLPVYTYSCDTPTLVHFQNTSLGYNRWKWYFGDGTTSNVLHPSHNFPSLGLWEATLVVWNDTTGCMDSVSTTVDLLQLSLDATTPDTAVCKESTLTFTAHVTGGQANQYNWVIDGLNFIDTTETIDYTFYVTGYHTIKLITKDTHNCWDTLTKNNYVLVSWPYVNFGATPTNGCAPVNVQFTDSTPIITGTSITTRHWDFDDGNSGNATSANTSHLYPQAGTYDIKLIVTDNIGCTDSLTKWGYIKVKDPVANFSATPTTSCPGTPILFLNNSLGSPLNYLWDFGDGTTSTAVTPTHMYSMVGTFTVRLIVTDPTVGCSDTMTRVNYINITSKPQAAFTVSDTFKICPPLPVVFTNSTVGAQTYLWQFGDNSTSSIVNPSHVYNSGIFDIKLIATNQYGCKDTAYGRVRVLGYAGLISYTPLTGCAPLTVQFTALEPNIPGYIFDFADGTTFPTTGTTATHTYTHAGPYVPILVMTDNAGCQSSSIGLDTIKVDGVYGGFTFSPYPACDKGTLTFTDTSKGAFSTITSHTWIFHDGVVSTQNNPSHYYPGLGTYDITLIHTTSTGCVDTLDTSVTFYPIPIIDAGKDTTICAGDFAVLQPSGGTSYTWSPAGTLSCAACTNPQASPASSTLYTVTGTDAHGCSNTDTVRVNTKTNTTVVAGAGGEICEGASIQLQASGATQYNWTPSAGLSNSHAPDPFASPDTTTQYMLIAREGSCIPDTAYVNVVVNPRPHVNAGPDQTMIAGNSVQLNAQGNQIVQYAWRPSESLSCDNCQDPEASPKNTTTYTVVAYTDKGCSDSDRVIVYVICQQSQVYIPNTFTPNGDGQNDRFYPRGRGIRTIKSFKIYDRWGEVIFDRSNIDVNDQNQGWDGTFKGVELSPDVYVYTIDGICDTGEEFSWQADISLIR